MKNYQDNTNALPALLRTAKGGDTLEPNSLCCAAAGITAPLSATAEALIPHEKLRGAALADATLNAQERPLAQPAEGYMQPECVLKSPRRIAVDVVQIDERAEYDKEFPVLEGLQYCSQRDTYHTTPDAKTSDSSVREHSAHWTGLAAWKRRAWKHAVLISQRATEEV